MTARSRRVPALGALLALVVLLVAAPTPAAALEQLRDVAGATDPTAPLVAAVALLAWALAGWLLLTAALVLGSRVPGAAGRAAAVAARRVAPVVLRRLVGAALGVAVVAGAASPAAAALPGAAPATPAAVAQPGALDWPGAAAPSLDWPAPPAVAPQPPSSAAARAVPTSTGEAADAVVVRPGDSLWGLAEQSLAAQQGTAPTDPEVAQAWPAWWSANREVVGDDPDLLLPGITLQPPAPDTALDSEPGAS